MELDKPQILTYAEKSLNYTVHCARWVPSSCRFVALGERPRGTGAFQIYEIEGKFLKFVYSLFFFLVYNEIFEKLFKVKISNV